MDIKDKVVIVIPTYNEAKGIAKTIKEVFRVTSNIVDTDIKILIFDSASTDDTQKIVTSLQESYPNLLLKKESHKSGLGSAYLQAMHYVLDELSADILIEFDADLSHQPSYLPAILDKMKSHDVVVGSRYVPGGSIPQNWRWDRKLLSILGNYLAQLILTSRYKDWTSGFRATRTSILKKVLPKQFLSNDYAYKLHLLWLLHKNKASIWEYPIQFIDRTDGESKLPKNSIVDSLRVLFVLRCAAIQDYFKMSAIGFTGMCLQLTSYNLLRFYLPLKLAAQIAVFIAVLNNFVLNNRYTFRARPISTFLSKLKAFTLFSSYSSLMAYVQSYLLLNLVNLLGKGFLKENLFILLGIILGSFLNYFTYSRLIWRKKSMSNEELA